MLATPVETVARGDGDVERILALAAELDAMELIVGLPLSLAGTATASTDDATGFAARLAAATDLPVRLVDERLLDGVRAVRAAGIRALVAAIAFRDRSGCRCYYRAARSRL